MPQRQPSYHSPTQFSVFPPVIKNLLIINVVVFFAQFVAVATDSVAMGEVLNAMALYPPGGGDVGYTIFGMRTEVPGFWPWQLVTYAFLHSGAVELAQGTSVLGGVSHLLFNMFALWMFGAQIERQWGSRRFGIFYFFCVIGAALTQIVVTWGSPVPTLGASGGVFGVLLAFGMMFPERRIMLLFPPIPIKAKWFVMGLGAMELWSAVTGTQAGVANFAHLGGAVFGFLLIQFWRGHLPVQPQQTMRW